MKTEIKVWVPDKTFIVRTNGGGMKAGLFAVTLALEGVNTIKDGDVKFYRFDHSTGTVNGWLTTTSTPDLVMRIGSLGGLLMCVPKIYP